MKQSLTGHAYLVAGGAETIPAVAVLLGKEGVSISGNPDVYIRTYGQFGVDEARELRERASARAVSGARRIFIVATPGMTNEAQNALLKTLEEPPGNAMFFIIVPSPDMLLSTVRSRVERLTLSPKKRILEDGMVDAETFLSAAPEKRLDMLKPLLEKDDDDKRDIGAIVEFLASLERALLKEPEGLRAVYRARKFATDKGALIKPLLEQVALLTPRI
ncbi:hypothetical protein C4556_00745 [Candidatus Parcubacteria bacterium]|nr:MAG: hypothetical protein C4556_00745 [Candidatus Parcubacteria bacterium]